jgi:peptidoglycan/LPS O-acetylase OafA/YrhL
MLEEINILKGIAIIGVIIKHMQITFINQSANSFFMNIFAEFYMEIFMFASGFLFGFSRVEISSLDDYVAFIKKKFKRLMVPYFVISGVIFATKLIASKITTLYFPVSTDFWKYLLFNPVGGFATFLWFLYFLFATFLVFPVMQKLIKNSFLLWTLLLSACLIPIQPFFYFNPGLLRWFLLFFCAGYIYSNMNYEAINEYSKYLCLLTFALLGILVVSGDSIAGYLSVYINNYTVEQFLRIIIILLGTLAYYYLSVYIIKRKNFLFHVMKYLGTYSTSIYLLHTIAMGAAIYLFINVLQLSDNLYPEISVVIFLTGFIAPVLVTKYIINKFQCLPPLLLGIKRL